MSSLVSTLRVGAQRLILLASHYRYSLVVIAASYALILLFFLVTYRLALILSRPKPEKRPAQDANGEKRRKGHLLVVLGSGGHTSEMLSVLQNLGPEYLNSRFGRRTWVVSSGDAFSAERARRFEESMVEEQTSSKCQWDIVTVHRARKVHQPLYTAPVSCLQCLWDCIRVLRGTHPELRGTSKGQQNPSVDATATAPIYPDLILTNGPATAVILILASLLLMFLGLAPINPTPEEGGAMRSIYIESWARVKTLSLSGKILQFMIGRFLVQWKGLEDVDLTRPSQSGDQDKKSKLLKRRIEHVGAVAT